MVNVIPRFRIVTLYFVHFRIVFFTYSLFCNSYLNIGYYSRGFCSNLIINCHCLVVEIGIYLVLNRIAILISNNIYRNFQMSWENVFVNYGNTIWSTVLYLLLLITRTLCILSKNGPFCRKKRLLSPVSTRVKKNRVNHYGCKCITGEKLMIISK